MLDFLVFDTQEYSAMVNTRLFITSGWLMLVVGILYGLLKHQYGRWIKQWSLVVSFIVLVYIIGLMLTVDFAYAVLYMWFICGSALVSLIYHIVLPSAWYLGPQLSRLVTSEFELENGMLRFTHPAVNHEGRCFPHDQDYKDDQFEHVSVATYAFKRYMQRTWFIYDRKGSSIASIRLEVSVQDIGNMGDLRRIENLNGAAAIYYFNNHALPDDEYDVVIRKDEYTYEPDSFSNWRKRTINDRDAITYDIIKNGRGYRIQYLHCALSDSLMLTLEFNVIADTNEKELLDRVDSLIEVLVSGFTLVNEPVPGELNNRSISTQNPQSLQNAIKPPDFANFNVSLPTTQQHMQALRQMAQDKVEWMVFENSDLFQGWYLEQSYALCLQFEDMRLAFIDSQLKKYRASGKQSSYENK